MKDEIPYTKSFVNWLDLQQMTREDKDNMFPVPLNAQEALNFLMTYLLGPDFYIVDPISNEQSNVIIVDKILSEYSKEYRKEKYLHDLFKDLENMNYDKKSLLYKLFKYGFYGKRYQNLLNNIEKLDEEMKEIRENVDQRKDI